MATPKFTISTLADVVTSFIRLEEENISPCKSAAETAEKVKEEIDHQQKKVDRCSEKVLKSTNDEERRLRNLMIYGMEESNLHDDGGLNLTMPRTIYAYRVSLKDNEKTRPL